MVDVLKSGPVALVTAALIASATPSGVVRAEDCIPDWGQAGAIVRAQKLLTVAELTKKVASDIGGTIVQATLCKDSDDYIYKLLVKGQGGQIKTVVLDARGKGLPEAGQ